MIDEKKLIKSIKDVEVAWYIDGNYTTYDSTTIMDIIEEQPKISEWIPCNRELPKEGMFYNVTVFDGEDYRVEPAYYAKIGYLGQRNMKANWWTDCTSNAELIEVDDDVVVAWMPLPEPYK